jgi:Flp pilus assembly secretin CpaC
MRQFAVAAALVLATAQAQAAEIWLTIDQVRPYEIERPAGQIVVGNPAIADLTVADKTRVMLYGKAPGLTNMYIFDDDGAVIENLVVRVRSTSNDMLTMHKGVQRITYACASQCEPTISVGDAQVSFAELSQQVMLKQQQAAASGAANAQ